MELSKEIEAFILRTFNKKELEEMETEELLFLIQDLYQGLKEDE